MHTILRRRLSAHRELAITCSIKSAVSSALKQRDSTAGETHDYGQFGYSWRGFLNNWKKKGEKSESKELITSSRGPGEGTGE